MVWFAFSVAADEAESEIPVFVEEKAAAGISPEPGVSPNGNGNGHSRKAAKGIPPLADFETRRLRSASKGG